MKITLPYPPSANRYWRNYRGRMVTSAEARAYKDEVGWLAKQAGIEHLDGSVVLYVDIYRPRRSGDLDNWLKVLLDALQGVAYEDDTEVVELHARRLDDRNDPRVEVEVRAVGSTSGG